MTRSQRRTHLIVWILALPLLLTIITVSVAGRRAIERAIAQPLTADQASPKPVVDPQGARP